VSWACWDWPLTWLTNHNRPSVLWHCWLGRLTHKIISVMTYNMSSGTLNPSVPYHTGLLAHPVQCRWQATFPLFLSIKFPLQRHSQNALQQISSCMCSSLLTLNSSKTQFLLIGLKQRLSKINNSSLTTTHSAHNLGFIFDELFTFIRLPSWFFNFNLLFISCGGLSWLPISYLLHIKYTLSAYPYAYLPTPESGTTAAP